MPADVSRVRFDPLRDFSAVVQQQGRVLLDSDFNELVAILDRRLRAETNDLTSFAADADHQGVAWVPRLTPDGFAIAVSGGDLTIGRGRMYVDGLLAENHGTGAPAFDAALAEQAGSQDLRYDEQPYWPDPDPLPGGGDHLVYLDVWEREITHVEDPSLVEVAVGVDTTARRQTVWQVRVLADAGSGACSADDDEIEGWAELIAPSTGRLSTSTVDLDPSDDPCELPPSGGFRGVENQTYRVEIHDGGTPGTATFKWSRDAGSVVMPAVEVISPTVLRLATLGRDDVLRISIGDWVEVVDDHRELDQLPGEVRRVADLDEAARTITLASGLPADLQVTDPLVAGARHLRVRRWDQTGTDLDTSGGVITVPVAASTEVALEHGIAVSFSVVGSGGRFRPGDHWVFAARTADTSIEILDAAPPRGVHHHYARLATVAFPDTSEDCRRLWPPIASGDACGGCTVCVTPEGHESGELTVQRAIDVVVESGGGTVCLAPGVYDLAGGVVVERARSVRLRGQGLATVLIARGTALDVRSSIDVTVEDLAVVGGALAPDAVALRNVVRARVENTAVLSFGGGRVGGSAVAIGGVVASVAIRRNVLVGPTAIDTTGVEKQRAAGALTIGLAVEDNLVAGVSGIDLGANSLHLVSTRIRANEVLSGQGVAVAAPGAVGPEGSLDVTDNEILASGGGIVVGPDALVAANAIGPLRGTSDGDGIVVALGALGAPPGTVQVKDNRIHDRTGRAIAIDVPVESVIVADNVMRDVGAGIVMAGKGRAEDVLVRDNVINGVEGGAESGSELLGIALNVARRVKVTGNSLSRLGVQPGEVQIRLGIVCSACEDLLVAGNTVQDVSPPDGFDGRGAGIAVVGPFHRATVEGNSAIFSTTGATPEKSTWVALLVASAGSTAFGLGRRGAVAMDDGVLVLTDGDAAVARRQGDHATVSSNTIAGGGRLPSGFVITEGDVVADGNQCEHSGGVDAFVLGGSTVTVATNRVRGGDSMIILLVSEERFSAVGNLAPAGTHLGGPGNGLPGPWDVLNPPVP